MEMSSHNSIVDRLLTFALQQSEVKSIVIHPRKKVLPKEFGGAGGICLDRLAAHAQPGDMNLLLL
jgi:hypothetical protein